MFQFGPAAKNWVPLVGDWNQDGVNSIGLYNPIGGQFFLKNSNASGAADLMFQFGPSGQNYKPLVGDWNGDGRTTIGIYNVTTSSFFLNNANAGGAANHVFNFGPANSNWKVISGDWNGDGTSGIGFYNNNAFFLKNAFSGGIADASFSFGPANSGWTPLAGIWTTTSPASLSTTQALSALQQAEFSVALSDTTSHNLGSQLTTDSLPQISYALPANSPAAHGVWDTSPPAWRLRQQRPHQLVDSYRLVHVRRSPSQVDHLFATDLLSLLSAAY